MDIDKLRNVPVSALLRRRAEEQMQAESIETADTLTDHETQRLLHELQVHQIELEIQNAELQQIRNELETSLEKYTDLYDFAPVGYVTLDRKEIIKAVNLAGASLVGNVHSRLIGACFGQFIADSDRPLFTDFLHKVLVSTIKETCELALVNKNNHPVIVQVEAMATASGQEFRLALVDITERKNLEAQLLLTRKMETVGLLAGGLAHNFDDILNAIISYGSHSEMSLKADDPLRVNMTRIIEAAERGTNITKNLQNFSRIKPSQPQHVDVNHTIACMETFLRMMLGEGIQLETVYSEGPLKIIADSGELQQVITNLVSNAMHAMPDGGTLSIATRAIAIDQAFIKLHGFGTPGEYALISLADTGIGMDRETMRKIFDPFFTTRVRWQQNSGLGLSIVYSTIMQHNGFIDVCSKPDKGSTFRLYLPLAGARDEPEKSGPENT